jgi:hypothetical protein
MAKRTKEERALVLLLDGQTLNQARQALRLSPSQFALVLNKLPLEAVEGVVYPVLLAAAIESARAFEANAEMGINDGDATKCKDRAAAAKYARENLAAALTLIREIDARRRKLAPPKPTAKPPLKLVPRCAATSS